MTKYILFTVLLAWVTSSMGDVFVHGHTRSNGTYVEPYYRSSPNGNVNDNWSTKPNTNPYTGREGTKVNSQYNDRSSINQTNTQLRNNSMYDLDY